MRLLITGATGAIGKKIVQQIAETRQDVELVVLVRDSRRNRRFLQPYSDQISIHYGDLLDEESFSAACKNIDMVFHLAGIIPPYAYDNEELTWKVNVDGTKYLIEALEKHSPKAMLVFSSSVVVYGDRLETPEIRVGDVLDRNQHDVYGRGKIVAEEMIRNSKLNWCILRLAAIMGLSNHKVSGIIFHVPLETRMEIATLDDTARAFVLSLDHLPELTNKTFNLGGGENCRLTYQELLDRSFKAFGMGKAQFPKHSFATYNFHCGDYMDGDDLENILHFRKDTLDTYFQALSSSIPRWQYYSTQLVRGIVKWYLSRLSEPQKAWKSKNKKEIQRFFKEAPQA